MTKMFHRFVPMWRRLLMALCGVVLWEPFALYTSGCWLSFMAVGVIGYAVGGRKHVIETPHPNPLPQGERGLCKFPPPLMGGGEGEGDDVNLFNSFVVVQSV